MKKLIAALLLVSMLLPTFVACTSTDTDTNNENKQDNTITDGSQDNSTADDSQDNNTSDDSQDNGTTDGGNTEAPKEPELSVAATTALGVNQVLVLELTYVPENEGDALTFTSSDTEVVACDSAKGTLTGLKEGTATITIENPGKTMTVTTEVTVTDPLKGASAAFFGDSICMASTHDKDHQWWGWAGRISAAYGLSTYINKGVDGASLSTCRPNNRIVNQLKDILNKRAKYTFLVLHGGTNDGMDSAPIGEMSDSFNVADFDTTTFAGGLEELFYYAKQYQKQVNPDVYIGYIINFKIEATSWGPLMTTRGMAPYYALAKKICNKWGVPYLDLFSDSEFCKAFKHTDKKLVPDGVHPSSAGYDILYPFIADFMRQLTYGA